MSETNVHNSDKMSITAPENVHNTGKMSITDHENVHNSGKMSITDTEAFESDFEIIKDKIDVKKNKRQQAIVGLIIKDPSISLETIAESLDVNKKTIWRDISELKENGVLERIGGSRFGGKWIVKH